jgi:hypothetical protein
MALGITAEFQSGNEEICRLAKEGSGYKAGGLPDRKDDAVDIIAWKLFPDGLPGKLILFGNCATEDNWEGSKKTELTPAAFCSDWMIAPPPCDIVKSLFIPHRVESRPFFSHLKRAGIIFDRCRTSYWAHGVGSITDQKQSVRFFDYSPLLDWASKQLKNIAG